MGTAEREKREEKKKGGGGGGGGGVRAKITNQIDLVSKLNKIKNGWEIIFV